MGGNKETRSKGQEARSRKAHLYLYRVPLLIGRADRWTVDCGLLCRLGCKMERREEVKKKGEKVGEG